MSLRVGCVGGMPPLPHLMSERLDKCDGTRLALPWREHKRNLPSRLTPSRELQLATKRIVGPSPLQRSGGDALGCMLELYTSLQYLELLDTWVGRKPMRYDGELYVYDRTVC